MATAKGGYGAKLMRDDGTGTFVQIAGVIDIDGPQISKMMEDSTDQDVADGYSTKIDLGIRDVGQINITIHNDPNQVTQDALLTDLNSTTPRNYRILFPGALKRLAGPGTIENISNAFPLKGKMVQTVTLTPTGKWVKEAHP